MEAVEELGVEDNAWELVSGAGAGGEWKGLGGMGEARTRWGEAW